MANEMVCLQENGIVSTLPKFHISQGGIHIWKMSAAVVWSIIIQFMMFVTYAVFISRDIFHPLSWLANCFGLFSSSLWPKLVALVIIIYTQGEVCKKDYVTGPVYHDSRFQKIRHMFCIRNVLLMLLHILIGITVFWIYSSTSDNSGYFFTKPCERNINHVEKCLIENNLFLLLGGIWIGLFYFFNDYMLGYRNLSFPLIQQYKFYRVKAAVKDSIKHSIKVSIMPTIIFLVLYYLYGGMIRNMLLEIFSLEMDEDPIDRIQGLIDLSLIFSLWLFSSIFITGMQTMELLFNVYLTEHCTFPLCTNNLAPGNHITLIDSLKKTDVPIIHHLGYMDLFVLSTKCRQRREEIFSLSHPGGHPHCWNGIYQECIHLINVYISDLSQALQQDILKKEAPKQTNKPEVAGFHFHAHSVRKLASPVSAKVIGDRSVLETQSVIEVVYNNIQNWVNCKLEQLYKKPFIAYLFGESPDSRINFLLCKSQPVIWAVQSLAFLCAASLKEDRYGIVQKDLPNIITTMINLKQVLDKIFKQNHLIVKKSFAKDPLDLQMKYLLRSSVQRSLYLIAVSFGAYIKDLQLPVDVEIQINNFIAFKEI